jgi:putative Mg2+ transporter-C (MgtC) family protein
MSENATAIPFDQVFFRMGAAAIIGAVIGLNRELHGKSAGLRTQAMVGLSGAMVIALSIEVSSSGAIADMGAVTRVIQGVLTGIGFLGAGVIFHDSTSKKVSGLTTAATVWVVACIGMACGAGRWRIVLAATVITLLLLVVGGPVEQRFDQLMKRRQVDKLPDEPGTPDSSKSR